MKLPGLSYLKDKWVLGGLLLGAGIYYLSKHGYGKGRDAPWLGPAGNDTIGGFEGYVAHYDKSKSYFPDQFDGEGLYEGGGSFDFNHMRFSGQAELRRRLTIT